MRFAVACVVIIIAVAIGATHKNEVKAAWNKMTSLISRILGSTEDADDYVKQIQKTIRKNGIAVSLEEVAMDHENLWIAYSLSNESGDNDISMNSAEAVIDGKNLALEGGSIRLILIRKLMMQFLKVMWQNFTEMICLVHIKLI